jgi:molybdopterin synthase sulfur carrier subunit
MGTDSWLTVRFWAGARRAAGQAERRVALADAADVGQLRRLLAASAPLRDVVAVASFLVDETAATDATRLAEGSVVDVLPPFAGGQRATGS